MLMLDVNCKFEYNVSMDLEIYDRSIILLGEETLKRLATKKIIVFGVGGVGSFAVEALARSGIENITLVDNDIIKKSNINRQLLALFSTIGRKKIEVAKERILDINPSCNVDAIDLFYSKDNFDKIELTEYDYIVDAIDTVSTKIYLAQVAFENNINIISSMGTGNKMSPFGFKVCDIFETKIDPLARVMRRELKKANVKKLKVIYSEEEAKKTETNTIGSLSYVPSVAGLMLASTIINELIKE